MLTRGLREQATPLLQMLDNILVGVLDILTDEVSNLGGESARGVHRAHDRTQLGDELRLQAHSIVVLAEVGRLVNDARAALACHVRVGEDLVGGRGATGEQAHKVVE